MRRRRPDKAGSAFLILWMTFWLAAILIALWTMGAAALSGEPVAALILLVWVGAAVFGLISAGRSLRALLLGERPEPRVSRNHGWNDGLDRAAPPPPRPRRDCPLAAARAAPRLPRPSIVTLPAGHRFRGPLFMTIATGSYVVNDTFMKLATEGLPPYEVLTMRGVAATLWGLPLLLLLGYGRQLPMVLDRRVLARNLCETAAILCYVIALANMPIADATALGQITPLLIILGAAFLFRERIGGVRAALIGTGFIGALMVAQPSGAGISIYALLALGNAVLCAARDIVSRGVRPEVPGLIVAFSAAGVVLVAAAAAHLLTEEWVAPNARHVLLLTLSGLFLMGGHFFIFTAYRSGSTHVVAPFYYTFTLWAVVSGALVFGYLPNRLALAGILLVCVSGLAVVLLDERRRRPVPAA